MKIFNSFINTCITKNNLIKITCVPIDNHSLVKHLETMGQGRKRENDVPHASSAEMNFNGGMISA